MQANFAFDPDRDRSNQTSAPPAAAQPQTGTQVRNPGAQGVRPSQGVSAFQLPPMSAIMAAEPGGHHSGLAHEAWHVVQQGGKIDDEVER